MSFTEKLANGLAVVLIQRYNPWYELFTQIAKVSKNMIFFFFLIFLKIFLYAITNLYQITLKSRVALPLRYILNTTIIRYI